MSFDTELTITRTHEHHHADTLLSYHADLRALLEDSVGSAHRLEGQIRRERAGERLGVSAPSLNRALRESFGATGQWTFEAVVSDSVIFDNADDQGRIGGFDIARFDEAANLARLWSLCFGRRALHEGERFWRRMLDRRPDLAPIADALSEGWTPGTDPPAERATPTILGEIQFGNWALMYRDVLKVLAARTETDVDLFLYVVADGHLATMISSGTVNYDKFIKDLIGPFADVLTVPTWVVGVDFAEGREPDLDVLTSPDA